MQNGQRQATTRCRRSFATAFHTACSRSFLTHGRTPSIMFLPTNIRVSQRLFHCCIPFISPGQDVVRVDHHGVWRGRVKGGGVASLGLSGNASGCVELGDMIFSCAYGNALIALVTSEYPRS